MGKIEWKIVELKTYLVLGVSDGGEVDADKIAGGAGQYFFETGMTYDELREKCEENNFSFREIGS